MRGALFGGGWCLANAGGVSKTEFEGLCQSLQNFLERTLITDFGLDQDMVTIFLLLGFSRCEATFLKAVQGPFHPVCQIFWRSWHHNLHLQITPNHLNGIVVRTHCHTSSKGHFQVGLHEVL